MNISHLKLGGKNNWHKLDDIFELIDKAHSKGMKVRADMYPYLAGATGLIAALPVLGYARWAKTAENSTDYSLQSTVQQALFLPTTREQKYKAKQAIDTVFVRAGDVLSALLVYVGVNVFALSTRQFALVNLGLVAVWFVLAVRIGREYRRLTAD